MVPLQVLQVRRTHLLVQDVFADHGQRIFPNWRGWLTVNTLTGASWYVLNTAANALPTDGRWLIAQITTTGSISGTFNYQVFPLGRWSQPPDSSILKRLSNCMDGACNYNAEATNEDGSCELVSVECGCMD